jgi:hypothetical protein
MALPKYYLTTSRNLDGILAAMQTAQAPQTFNRRFLEGLGYKSSSDRLIINVLKALGFLSSDNKPTERYFEFLDQTQAGRVLGEALEEAYGDLYQINRKAHDLSKAEVQNKLRTLTRGQFSDGVLGKMAMTFKELSKHADFEGPSDGPPKEAPTPSQDDPEPDEPTESPVAPQDPSGVPVGLGGLVYNIQIQLPESRDQAVYDALFRSLKTHLLG